MFITNTRSGYNRDGEQICHGLFLIVVQDHNDTASRCKLRALVRHVKMRQFGHWMTARVRLGGHPLVLSGTYGSDGLPVHLPTSYRWDHTLADAILPQMVEVPPDLVEVFWQGGGHNTGGSEMNALRAWALSNLKTLRAPLKEVKP